ncbi:hypothetical protein [Streptomyces sp. NPDC013489]|uniref:hypothetical protein n=1 Tax=Streptomyces sp. NPDC013489 TaxID=3155606 RepID=UPI0033C36BD0
MSTPTYPETFRATSAYLTAYIDIDDTPVSEQITENALADLCERDSTEVVVVLTAIAGALVEQLAIAQGRTAQEVWAEHAIAYTTVLAERGE